jgi:hypothetical protein
MQTALLGTVLAASLVGSLHCAAMCGGLVAWYAGSQTDRGTSLRSHAAYHGGRFATYLTLGAVAGLLGAGLDRAGSSLSGLGSLAAVVSFALLLLWGGARLLEASGARLPQWSGFQRAYGRVLARLARLTKWPRPLAAGLLGLASALLPCGWLYAFVLVAAGTGSASNGIAVMVAFWLGTVPMLLGLGLGLGALLGRLRRNLPLLGASAIVVVGLVGLLGRVNVPARLADAAQQAGAPISAPQVPAQPPCHRGAD